MFWIIAVSIGLLTGIAIFWPLIRGGGNSKYFALALVIFIPVFTMLVYQKVGSPEGIDVNGSPVSSIAIEQRRSTDDQLSNLTQGLEQRLTESPDNLEGWLLLGRTYKTTQQYSASVAALSRAIELAPENALVIVELAEAKMFSSGNPLISQDITDLLHKALALDPGQQKGLWLLGLASTQSGDDARAIDFWERLLAEMDPSIAARAAIQDQIGLAQSRLGLEVGLEIGLEPAVKWHGLDIEVTLGDPDYKIPQNAVLFVIARNPDTPGPPLGVRRIANPEFPVVINMTDADSMIPASPVSRVHSIQLLARLSLSGSPTTGESDPESAVKLVSPETLETSQLVLIAP